MHRQSAAATTFWLAGAAEVSVWLLGIKLSEGLAAGIVPGARHNDDAALWRAPKARATMMQRLMSMKNASMLLVRLTWIPD